MSLQVWLPLNGNVKNQGLAGDCIVANSVTYGEGGKLHKFYRNGGKLTIDKNYIGLYGSIAFWIYVDENTDYTPNVIFGNNSSAAGADNRKWTLHLYPNRNSLHSWGLQSDTSSATPIGYFTVSNIIPDGVWTHICITHSKNGKQTIYANGEQVFQNTVDISGTYTFDVETNVCYNENNIKIQDIRIYDHTLSKEEVKEISKGLVLHYNFEPVYGNENIIKNSYKGYSGTLLLNEKYNGFGINYIKWGDTTGTYKENCRYYDLFQPEPDTYYTLSFWGKGNSICVCYFYPNTVTTTDTSQGWHGTSNDGHARITLSSEWKRYWVVWKTRSDINEIKSVLVGRLLRDGTGTTSDSECYIAGVKLEKGNTATPWSPNPNDTEYNSELATTVYDSSGYGRNGVKNGNLLFNKDSAEGEYSLDARGEDFISYVRCENAPQIKKDFTWNIWVKQNNAILPHVVQMPVSQGRDYVCYGMNIAISNGVPRIIVGGNSEGNVQVGLNLGDTLDNNWHMITGVVDNEGHIFGYIDGELKGRYISDSIYCEYSEAQGNLVIGKMSFGYASITQYFSFNGLIDDFRIYATALSADDIKSLYEVKCHIDKNGNIKSGIFEEQNVGDELLTTQKLVLGQNVSYATEASIEYIINNNQVINKITFGETNTQWKTLTSTKFDKNIILGKKLLWSFSWKTDSQFDKVLPVSFRQSNGLNPIELTPSTSSCSGSWTKYTGIMTMDSTYVGNQGLYIAVGDNRYINNILYIKDLSLKIYDEEKISNVNKKYIIQSGEFNESYVETYDMKLKTLDEDGSKWARIFYHNNHGGTVLFNSIDEVKNTQTSDKYSRLYLLDSDIYKNNEYKFEFMLCYPTDTNKYNRWKQTNNPCNEYVETTLTGEGLAEGYEAIHIDSSSAYWGGLTRQASDPTYLPSTYLSGSVGHGNWYYAVGAKSIHTQSGVTGVPSGSGFMPACVTANDVELWVRIDNVESKYDNVQIGRNFINSNEIIEI